MKAPEKIYLHPDEDGEVFGKPWSSIPFNKHNVEYTRTDVIIKKIEDWFAEVENGIIITDVQLFSEDLIEYLKG